MRCTAFGFEKKKSREQNAVEENPKLFTHLVINSLTLSLSDRRNQFNLACFVPACMSLKCSIMVGTWSVSVPLFLYCLSDFRSLEVFFSSPCLSVCMDFCVLDGFPSRSRNVMRCLLTDSATFGWERLGREEMKARETKIETWEEMTRRVHGMKIFPHQHNSKRVNQHLLLLPYFWAFCLRRKQKSESRNPSGRHEKKPAIRKKGGGVGRALPLPVCSLCRQGGF
mmetsp:Transcript_17383/g.35304  ORF Transcript_17383/g.35304 Transcript_17383/m.35304 type:complete len:225 (+) Transcript_17383:1329-2003(+)